MNQLHNANTRRLVEAVLTSPGETGPALRRMIKAYAAKLVGHPDEQAGKLPAELSVYVNKVARHAYKTTDEDIEALRRAGYSEDAIYVCAFFNIIDRVADSLDFKVLSPEEFARRAGRFLEEEYL